MDVLQGIVSLPPADGPTVVTVGFFDGVHRGHQAVIGRTVEEARARGARSVAVTFDRHPREILTPGREPRLLTAVERKASIIEELGVNALVVLEFTQEFSHWVAEEFIRSVLVEGLRVQHVVVGDNFTFGHKAMGTVSTLVDLGPSYGFTAEGVPLLAEGDRRISSSSVRDALAEGDLEWPLVATGRRFVLDGEVVTGAGRGHELGYPTANLRTWPRLLLPGRGIYAGRAQHGKGTYRAAISVGTNPTFGVEPLHVEAYLLDFDGELLGQPLSVEFWTYLRDEERFETPEELVRAMDEDVRRTRELVPAAGAA